MSDSAASIFPSGFTVLIRPAIFVIARVATFSVRAYQADGHYQKTTFIAEQILLLCGFVLICNPLLQLVGFHITRNSLPSAGGRSLETTILRLMELALMAALGLGIYAGTLIGDVGSHPDKINTLKTCRDINAYICAALTAVACLVVVLFTLTSRLPVMQSLHLVIMGVLLCIASVYKIVIYLKDPPPDSTAAGTKLAFYVFSSVSEVIVSILLFAFNLNSTYLIPEAKEKARVEKAMKDGTYRGDYGGIDGHPMQNLDQPYDPTRSLWNNSKY
ncbi:hypothetical protein MNV49_002859 [Pseudohyphozyma bogoriensis]|nr:hypothetical protein MNV49_002859 [Pseudohyphozyma bogoriensis]